MPETKLEPCTELTCEQCGAKFRPRNRNGVKARFCAPKCSRDWHNARRLKGAAMLNGKKPRRKRDISMHAQKVSQAVFLALVPVEERAELLRQAAENLGITNQDAIEAAMRRVQVPSYEGSV